MSHINLFIVDQTKITVAINVNIIMDVSLHNCNCQTPKLHLLCFNLNVHLNVAHNFKLPPPTALAYCFDYYQRLHSPHLHHRCRFGFYSHCHRLHQLCQAMTQCNHCQRFCPLPLQCCRRSHCLVIFIFKCIPMCLEYLVSSSNFQNVLNLCTDDGYTLYQFSSTHPKTGEYEYLILHDTLERRFVGMIFYPWQSCTPGSSGVLLSTHHKHSHRQGHCMQCPMP